jgi:hypothetical protein
VKKNIFSKAIKQLKSTEVDEKIQKLDESSPTNSISGLYSLNEPGFRLSGFDPPRVFYPDVDGNYPTGIPGEPGSTRYVRPAGYWDEGPGTVAAKDWDRIFSSDNGWGPQAQNVRNTDTMIDKDSGYVNSPLPPDSRSFILGPIVDSYVHVHGYDNITRVGYIQKDTREFVLLGYIDGQWGQADDGSYIRADGYEGGSWRIWDGQESGFTAVNRNFTFSMLQWFHNYLKSGRYTQNISYYLSGGIGCCVGCGGAGQPPGSVGGNGPGGGGGGGPWPRNNGENGQNPETGRPNNYGGPPNQSPPPEEGTPQDPPKKGDPNESGYPWGEDGRPRKRRKPGDPGYDPDIDGDSTKWDAEGNPIGDDGEPVTEPEPDPEKSNDPNAIQAAKNFLRDKFYDLLNPAIRSLPDSNTKMAGQVYLDYLTGKGPKVFDNNYLGQKYVDDYFKSAEPVYKSDSEFVLRGKDNVIATSGSPTYNKKSGEVTLPFDYDFKTNEQEFDNTLGGNYWKSVYGALGKYAGDSRVNLPGGLISQLTTGFAFGKTTEVAKQLGGAGYREGKITISMERLKKINPSLAAQIEYHNEPLPGFPKTQKESVAPDRRKQILREIKKPYVLPEAATPKPMKMNFKGKFSAQNMPSVTASKQSDDLVRSKNAAGQTWRTKDKYWGGYESTERMNVVYDRAGHGDLAFNMVVNENQKAKNMQERKLQEHLNTLAHDAAMRKLDSSYQSPFRNTQTEEQQPVEEPKEPKAEVVKKITKKLKGGDYEGKPAKNDYPNDPPQKQINGYHPDLVTGQKVASRFNRLDPVSARATPKTAYPAIDKKVEKAKKEPK